MLLYKRLLPFYLTEKPSKLIECAHFVCRLDGEFMRGIVLLSFDSLLRVRQKS